MEKIDFDKVYGGLSDEDHIKLIDEVEKIGEDEFIDKYIFRPYTYKYKGIKVKFYMNGEGYLFKRHNGEFAGYLIKRTNELDTKIEPPEYLLSPFIRAISEKGTVIIGGTTEE